MRQLRKNKRKLYYANFITVEDIDGGTTTLQDGTVIPIKKGQTQTYSAPIEFEANFGVRSGETFQSEYGLNVGDYNAVISAEKGILPFSEQTLIWHTENAPTVKIDGSAIPETADYKVIAIKTSLNEERFILKARVKDNA